MMRGIFRRLIFGLLFLAAAGSGARAADDPSPVVLSGADAARYGAIFDLQRQGLWDKAERIIATVEDRRLIGHVLARRYLGGGYRMTYEDLAQWLERYGDHPDAARIYELALKRRSGRTSDRTPWPKKPPPAPSPLEAETEPDAAPPVSWTQRVGGLLGYGYNEKLHTLVRAVAGDLRAQRVSLARRRLMNEENGARALSGIAFDEARTALAWGYFVLGNDQEAFDLASASAAHGGARVPWASWVTGLAAWRLERIDEAAKYFAAHADAARNDSWERSAGTYWAARAQLKLGDRSGADRRLNAAARNAGTFYGLLARRALGRPGPFESAAEMDGPEFALPTLRAGKTESDTPLSVDIRAIESTPAGRRALALVQIGETERAEGELRFLYGRSDRVTERAILGFALHAHLDELAAAIDGAGKLDPADYPVPEWQPADGFRIDPAVIYGIARHESNFNSQARNPASGARGLMQLMPGTARITARKLSDGLEPMAEDAKALLDPETNLALGQRYLEHLFAHERINGNLILAAAAYNAGEGNLVRWLESMDYRGDPLLFIESIPAPETRAFVERVTASVWIYQDRLGRPTPALDDLVAIDWPVGFSQAGASPSTQ